MDWKSFFVNQPEATLNEPACKIQFIVCLRSMNGLARRSIDSKFQTLWLLYDFFWLKEIKSD